MNRCLTYYILGILSAFILVQILSNLDRRQVIKVPNDFNTIGIDDELVGYFDKDSIFHLMILDKNLIHFRWNDIEQNIPRDGALIQIDFTEENTVYLKPI